MSSFLKQEILTAQLSDKSAEKEKKKKKRKISFTNFPFQTISCFELASFFHFKT